MREIKSATEEERYAELIRYLRRLDICKIPFDCPNLIVLPEGLKLIAPNYPSESYPKSTLICMYSTLNDLSKVCLVNSDLKYCEGNLEFECRFGFGQFKVRLVDFKIGKKY